MYNIKFHCYCAYPAKWKFNVILCKNTDNPLNTPLMCTTASLNLIDYIILYILSKDDAKQNSAYVWGEYSMQKNSIIWTQYCNVNRGLTFLHFCHFNPDMANL